MGNKVGYGITAYIDCAGIQNIDSVAYGLESHLERHLSKKQNLLPGMDPVSVSFQEFSSSGPRFKFGFTGEMGSDRLGIPDYDFDDFKAVLKTAFEDYKGDPVIVDNEPLTDELQGFISDYAYLDKNTPFPEMTVSEMVDGILAGELLA